VLITRINKDVNNHLSRKGWVTGGLGLGQRVLVQRDPFCIRFWKQYLLLNFILAPLTYSAAPSPSEPAPFWGLIFRKIYSALHSTCICGEKRWKECKFFLQIFWVRLFSIIPNNCFIITVYSFMSMVYKLTTVLSSNRFIHKHEMVTKSSETSAGTSFWEEFQIPEICVPFRISDGALNSQNKTSQRCRNTRPEPQL